MKNVYALLKNMEARLEQPLPVPLEDSYRRHCLPDDIALARKGLLLFTLTILINVYGEFMMLGFTPLFFSLFATRLLISAMGLLLYLRLPAVTSPLRFDRLILAYGLLFAIASVPVILSRPAAYTHSFLLVLVVLLGFYVLFPARLVFRAAAPVFMSVVSLVVLHFFKEPQIAKAVQTIWVSFILVNIIGIMSARQFNRSRRTQYTAEQSKAASEGRFRLLVENANAIVYALSPSGVFTYVSPTWTQLLGHDVSEVVGRSFEDFVDAADIPAARLFFAAVVVEHKKMEGIEYRVRHKNGEWRWHTSSASPSPAFVESDGQVVVFVGIARDITEKKRLEEELKNAKEDAEKANKAKSEFLANTSHEIRTPLHAILGMTQLAMEAEMEPKQRNYLLKIRESGEVLQGIISDILDLSRIEAGKLSPENVPFNPFALMDYIRDAFSQAAETKGLKLNVWVDAQTPQGLWGDLKRLRQILTNLTANAVKFTETGYVTVLMQALGDNVYRFSVSDSGIGMDDEQMNEVFKPFTQADGSISRRFGGTGLGLTIAKGLVEFLAGELTVSSKLGFGATFSFDLKLSTDCSTCADPNEHTEVDKAVPTFARFTILLVEDVPTNRQVVQGLLQATRVRVVAAENGREALQRLSEQKIDLVLMDVEMPVMDGLEATREIRKNPAFNALPVIALTAGVMSGSREACLAEGMNDFLGKPISRDLLFQTINRHLPRPRILVADDISLNRLILAGILGEAYEMAEAADGTELLQLASDNPPDLVILDLMMPGMDGIETLRRLRQNPYTADIPVIFMSASDDPAEKQECLDAGGCAVLGKPIGAAELLKTVRSKLGR